jgi:hypothetical protein
MTTKTVALMKRIIEDHKHRPRIDATWLATKAAEELHPVGASMADHAALRKTAADLLRRMFDPLCARSLGGAR